MLFSFHSKLAFSLFASSKIKKRIVEEKMPYQFGSKLAGAEAVVHTVQLALFQNPRIDILSADASLNLGKSFYLMQPTDDQFMTDAQVEDRIDQLVQRGVYL